MKMRSLGSQGLRVPALGLGCMGMHWAYQGGASEAECLATIQRALELGANFLDTAEVYGPFANEELIGKAIAGRRPQAILATKFGFVVRDGKIAGVDSSPARLRASVEGSLRRLGTDYLDLLYQHRLDPATPIETVVGEMARLVQEGKVRFIGLSEAGDQTIRRAHAVWPLTAVQSESSLWERGVETSILPTLRELGIGFVAFAPMGRGFLASRFRSAADIPDQDYRRTDPRFSEANFAANLRIVEILGDLEMAYSCSRARIALAWVLSRGEDVVAIPGASRVTHLEDNVQAAQLELRDRDLKVLNDSLPPTSGARYSEAMMRFVDS
jgi:aryl-alcohol dehydrogenase-like predicted oxidoreductase